MDPLVLRTQIPEGVKDRLPKETVRLKRLSATVLEVYRRWGYREVITPTFEFYDAVGPVTGRRSSEELYQFFDRRGRTLALRPDLTTPVARLAATRLAGAPLPLRLCYCGNVFRYPNGRGGLHEAWQVGVELIGAAGPAADAEVVALACEAMAAAGLEGFKVGLGHVDVVEGLFAVADLKPEVAAALKAALVARDFVSFEAGIAQAGLAGEIAAWLQSLATFTGSWQDAAERLGAVPSPRVGSALRRLGEIMTLLEAYGVAGAVSLDLGLVRSLDYYTGVVFEAYAPGVGAAVCGGGRYDQLLGRFGSEQPATGFGLDLDRVLAAAERQNRLSDNPPVRYLLACAPGQEAEAFARAARLRADGCCVEVDLSGRSPAELAAAAQARGAQLLGLHEPEPGPRIRRKVGDGQQSIH